MKRPPFMAAFSILLLDCAKNCAKIRPTAREIVPSGARFWHSCGTHERRALADLSGRLADRLAAAQASVILSFLRRDMAERAKQIEQAMRFADIGESSALRALGNKKQVMAEGLVALISSRG
jgi:hypothetical protein